MAARTVNCRVDISTHEQRTMSSLMFQRIESRILSGSIIKHINSTKKKHRFEIVWDDGTKEIIVLSLYNLLKKMNLVTSKLS